MSRRKALVVGIDNYGQDSLNYCRNDAKDIAKLLKNNEDGSLNFDVKELCDVNTKSLLKENIRMCFDGDDDVAVFYYSGHGAIDSLGGYLVTPDWDKNDLGVSLYDVLCIVNESHVRNKIIIIDSCYSGYMGKTQFSSDCSVIKDGVTILTACTSKEMAIEKYGHGIFTELLLEALKGGAADILGRITAASVYAYIDRNLGAWEQRPIFKTNISNFISIRNVKPSVDINVLRETIRYFDEDNYSCQLNPSFEYTNAPKYKFECIEPYADKNNIKKFKNLQKLESIGLVVPEGEEHMYFAAMKSKKCKLTNIGKYYYNLIKNNKI